MSEEFITGQAVSDLSSISRLEPDDLLLVSTVSSENGQLIYQSKKIKKADLFSLLSSELGYFEQWIFSYDDINGNKQSVTKNVFISK